MATPKRSLVSIVHSYLLGLPTHPKAPQEAPLLRIQSTYTPICPQGISSEPYTLHMAQIISRILPQHILDALVQADNVPERLAACKKLLEMLPLIAFSETQPPPSTFCATLLVAANLTQGVGRYFTDAVSRWLLPGKFLPVFSTQSLNFHFEGCPEIHFFAHQNVLPVEDEHELALMQSHYATLSEEIKLTITSVQRARKIFTTARLKPEQKRSLIEEAISSILNRPVKEVDSNVFDQMHHFLLKLSGEEKEAAIKTNFSHLMNKRPFLFDRDIFGEIRHFILLFKDRFTALRSHRHIAKTISLLYFFRKLLSYQVNKEPQKRHFKLRLFTTELSSLKEKKQVLSVIIGINILQENELLGQRHILSAIEQIVPHAKKVQASFTVDRRTGNGIRLFYLEIESKLGTPLSASEIDALKKRLPRILQGKIENVLHPVVLSRNEEEILRNIVLLSQELKYVHDIPQVFISFDAQMQKTLSFTVILLRLVHPGEHPLQEALSLAKTVLSSFDFEVKQVGMLRKRYPKEANVFRVEIDKTPFLRKDFSLDLFKARLVVSEELAKALGEIRDFNGGILSKQQEALLALKAAVKTEERSSDFLVENFFYSITPAISRTLLYTEQLATLYRMQCEALERDFSRSSFWIKALHDEEYALTLIASPYGPFRKEVEQTLARHNIPPLDLCTTYNDGNAIACLGIIHRSDNVQKNKLIHSALLETLTKTLPHPVLHLKNS